MRRTTTYGGPPATAPGPLPPPMVTGPTTGPGPTQTGTTWMLVRSRESTARVVLLHPLGAGLS